jgi:hypothetical protein
VVGTSLFRYGSGARAVAGQSLRVPNLAGDIPMAESAESAFDPTLAVAVHADATAKPRIKWGRAAFFFLLGFVLLAEPLMLVLLLYKNGTLG